MEELVFDTNILIDHLRGISKATEILEKVKDGTIVGYVSTLTVAELFAGKGAEDKNKRVLLTELLTIFNVIKIDEMIARNAGDFKRKYQVTLADAMIAATTYSLRVKLATKNTKDFKKINEITVTEPY